VPDALTLLDREWDDFTSSRRARRALLRWSAAAAVPAVPDMHDLLRSLQDREDPDGRDRLVYRLCLLASEDRDACLVVLATVRPGLNRVAQKYRRWWGWEETSSMTFAAALERVVTYPVTRRDRPAANIVLDVQNRLHRARARELTAERKLGRRVAEDSPEMELLQENPASAQVELAELVAEAVAGGRLTRPEANLIVRHRLLDVPAGRVAEDSGLRPSTVRAHRRRAEAQLRRVALGDDLGAGEAVA
jgi:hypothetical protein